MFDPFKQTIYCGLIDRLIEFCNERGYHCHFNGDVLLNDTGLVTSKEVETILRDDMCLPKEYDTRQYQLDGITTALNKRRCVLLASTGSGKSLIQYALIRFYEKMLPEDKKLLIIVPTTSLVYQMFTDFGDYSKQDESWDAEEQCHIIMAGKEKDTDKRIIISTWQSLVNLPKKYFHQFGFINADECHLAQAKSIKKIVESATNCKYRYGTTGTMKDAKTHYLTIEGLLGPQITVAKTKELIEQNYLSNMRINMVSIQYPEKTRKNLFKTKYQEEIEFIESHDKRTETISKMGDYLSSNTLFLFSRKHHGKAMFESLKKREKPDEIYYVDGSVSAEKREAIRAACEQPNKTVYVVASYQVFAVGINIKNLHNIVLASSTKSPVRLLQSIGRGLRLHDSKKECVIYDFADDLRYKSWTNYSMQHAKERELIYMKENFDYTKQKVVL